MNHAVETTAHARTGPGRTLARLRDERKLSIADVAQRLKYGARQIEALEAEEFDRLPGATFVRGMVRGYAKLLETDPDPLLLALEERYIPGEIDLDLRDKGIPFAHRDRHGRQVYLALSALALVVVAGVLYQWRVGVFPWASLVSYTPPQPQAMQPQGHPVPPPAASHEETQPPAANPAILPATPAALAIPASAAPGRTGPRESAQASDLALSPSVPQAAGTEARLRLEFDGESWVEIRDKDGKMLMSQLNPAGSHRLVSGRTPLSLVIGNAASVRLSFNDKPVDLKPYIQIEVARLTLN